MKTSNTLRISVRKTNLKQGHKCIHKLFKWLISYKFSRSCLIFFLLLVLQYTTCNYFAGSVAVQFFTSNIINKFSFVAMLVLLTTIAAPGRALATTKIKVNSNLTTKIIYKRNKKEESNYFTKQLSEINFTKQFSFKPNKENNLIFNQDLITVNLYKNVKSNLRLDFKVFRRAFGLRFIYAK